MTTKVLMIIFAILAGVSIAICFGGIIFGYVYKGYEEEQRLLEESKRK